MEATKPTHAEHALPDSWRRVRLGDVAVINPKRPKLNVDAAEQVTFVPMAAVSEDFSGIKDSYARPYSEVSKGYTYFEEDDLLFSKITPCLQNGKHATARNLINGFGFGSTEFHIVRAADSTNAGFLFRALTRPEVIKECADSFTGTAGQQRVQPDTLRSLPILLPPLPEQRAIATVLDSIDDAIEGAEAIIAATEGLRDALLQDLLTCGLPGQHTEFRDVPGLGTIPADWDVVRLGNVAEVAAGQVDPRDDRFQHQMFVAPDDIEPRTGRLLTYRTVSDAGAISGKNQFDTGDVLYSKIRPYLMKVYVPTELGLCSADVYPIRATASLEPKFLAKVVLSSGFTEYIRTCSDRTGIPKVNRVDLFKYQMALPSLTEQQGIAVVLDGVDAAIDVAREEAAGLRFLKESTADALLTGRVRVGPSMQC